VPTADGWLFVAAVMDLYSRQILGWSVSESLMVGGALQALARALVKRGHPTGVIHHSDRGVQYACRQYRRQLQEHGLVATRKTNSLQAWRLFLNRDDSACHPDELVSAVIKMNASANRLTSSLLDSRKRPRVGGRHSAKQPTWALTIG